MGKRLKFLFDKAFEAGGLVSRIRLASLTGMTSGQAESCADSTSLIDEVEACLRTIVAELPKPSSEGEGAFPPSGSSVEGPASALFVGQGVCLRRYLATSLELVSRRHGLLTDLKKTRERTTEACAHAMGVQRVSIWRCEKTFSQIRCTDLFERSSESHSTGALLRAQDFPAYFEALITERTIAANDAATDPRTACFLESYLRPLNIKSMLDVPIWLKNKMVGVLCVETTGEQRTWTGDDETFVRLLANVVAMSCERNALNGP